MDVEMVVHGDEVCADGYIILEVVVVECRMSLVMADG